MDERRHRHDDACTISFNPAVEAAARRWIQPHRVRQEFTLTHSSIRARTLSRLALRTLTACTRRSDKTGATPFHLACANGNLPVVQFLLQQPGALVCCVGSAMLER
jgi:hypothetical protein